MSLVFRVVDPAPTSGTAVVKIAIRTRSGRVVDSVRMGRTTVNSTHVLRYRVRLRPGRYVFTVSAVDGAGNASTSNGSNKLIVKAASRSGG